MRMRSFLLAAFLATAATLLHAQTSVVADVQLLQPLPDGSTSVGGSGVAAFVNYFNKLWPWVLSIAGGIAVLNGVIGGTMIMLSGSDSGIESAGKDKLKYSIAGLIIIVFAGTILRILNPTFYK